MAGFYPAIQGMRNPMNSWAKSDSTIVWEDDSSYGYDSMYTFRLGNEDCKLAQKLSKAGSEHRKYLRQIQVWADVTMPRYWWSEADTYKFGTKNSCSTMHRITEKEFTLDDFQIGKHKGDFSKDCINLIISQLNFMRRMYQIDNDYDWVIQMKEILPESYLQKRTLNTNYEEIMRMYHQRKHHRLKEEWQDTFCRWAETLPYFYELCIETEVK